MKRHIQRHIPLQDPTFYKEEDALIELKRVLDICNDCRLCLHVCTFFPKFFDIMDSEAVDGDVNKLTPHHITSLLSQCTLCDLCFMVKCPYVAPHPWNVDLPRILLRYKAIQQKKFSYKKLVSECIASVDHYGGIATACATPINKAMGCRSLRRIGEAVTGVHGKADMPPFRKKPLIKQWSHPSYPHPLPNPHGHAYGEEVWLYLTCSMNYYEASLAQDTEALLASWGVKVHALYPGCCGMPLWEQGHVEAVGKKALTIAKILEPFPLIVPLTPSCSFMLRSEWPSLWPHEDSVQALKDKTKDLCAYVLDLARRIPAFKVSLPPKVAVHMACHVRSQNQGNLSHRLLETLGGKPIPLIERCSGHGGVWGYMKEHFQEAITLGHKVIQESKDSAILVSECPLATRHLHQTATLMGIHTLRILHPISLLWQEMQRGLSTIQNNHGESSLPLPAPLPPVL